jgi:AcrR family transcriptional regulator
MSESPADGPLVTASPASQPSTSSPSLSSSPAPARRRPPDAKARTQARILDAAAALFAARGYEGASITAIATRAHVSRSAVFWHFGDKETLFRETFRQMLLPFAEKIANSLTHPDPAVRLLELLSVYERFVDEQRAAIQAFVRWTIESPTLRNSIREPLFAMHDHFARDVSEALSQALGDATSAEAMAMGILSMLHGNLLLAMVDGDPRRARLRRIGLRSVVERALASGSGVSSRPAPGSPRGDP